MPSHRWQEPLQLLLLPDSYRSEDGAHGPLEMGSRRAFLRRVSLAVITLGTSFLCVLDAYGMALAPLNALFQRDGNNGNMSATTELETFTQGSKNESDISGTTGWHWVAGGNSQPKDDLTEIYVHSDVGID